MNYEFLERNDELPISKQVREVLVRVCSSYLDLHEGYGE
jgi:hypothetical protein